MYPQRGCPGVAAYLIRIQLRHPRVWLSSARGAPQAALAKPRPQQVPLRALRVLAASLLEIQIAQQTHSTARVPRRFHLHLGCEWGCLHACAGNGEETPDPSIRKLARQLGSSWSRPSRTH
jgi:hypothetical protein